MHPPKEEEGELSLSVKPSKLKTPDILFVPINQNNDLPHALSKVGNLLWQSQKLCAKIEPCKHEESSQLS